MFGAKQECELERVIIYIVTELMLVLEIIRGIVDITYDELFTLSTQCLTRGHSNLFPGYVIPINLSTFRYRGSTFHNYF